MPIPDYQTLFRPVLALAADYGEFRVRDIIKTISEQFHLSEEERAALIPSGTQTYIHSRIQWATTYLKKAVLLTSPKRGFMCITERGRKILLEYPDSLRVKDLYQFPEFMQFYLRESGKDANTHVSETITPSAPITTPDEILATTYREIRRTLAQEILERIVPLSPAFFERLVVDLLVKMGYGGSFKDAGHTTRLSSDEGIDGVIKEDKLGLDSIYIQAKRWKEGNTVGRPEIQKFVGALAGQGAKKGIFITTSTFTKEAHEYKPMNDTKIVLIDGEELAELMIDYNLGVSTQYTYEIKRIDNDYFDEL